MNFDIFQRQRKYWTKNESKQKPTQTIDDFGDRKQNKYQQIERWNAEA